MRARNIKPGFFKNEELAELPMAARLLFEGLWCMADRRGRLDDRPKRIKAEILPYDDVDIDELLDQLHDAGFILRYESGGAHYIQVVNFGRHQSPHKNETDSVIPPPVGHPTSTEQAPEKHQSTRPDSLIPDSLIPDVLTEDSPTQSRDGRAGGGTAPYAIFAAYLTEMGKSEDDLSPAFKSQQLGIAKGLLDEGFGADKVRSYLRFLLAQDWRDEPITLRTVRKGIAGWEANGSPPLPRSRASPTKASKQDRTDQAFAEFSQQLDQLEGKHAAQHL